LRKVAKRKPEKIRLAIFHFIEPQLNEVIKRLATDIVRALLINVKKKVSNKGNETLTPDQDHLREVGGRL